MEFGRIVIISGSPGSGKSSVARGLAENSTYERAVHMHTDDFYGYIRKGYVLPWLSEAHEQNKTIIEAFTASAARLAKGGYEVIVDGVIGQNMLDPWLKMTGNGFDVRYVVLRPDEETTVSRAAGRKGEKDLTDAAVVTKMRRWFNDLRPYENHVVDTTGQSVDESVSAVAKLLHGDGMRLINIP